VTLISILFLTSYFYVSVIILRLKEYFTFCLREVGELSIKEIRKRRKKLHNCMRVFSHLKTTSFVISPKLEYESKINDSVKKI